MSSKIGMWVVAKLDAIVMIVSAVLRTAGEEITSPAAKIAKQMSPDKLAAIWSQRFKTIGSVIGCDRLARFGTVRLVSVFKMVNAVGTLSAANARAARHSERSARGFGPAMTI